MAWNPETNIKGPAGPPGPQGPPGASGSGTGDVIGPSSAVNDDIAVFDGTTGKLVKDGGAKLSDFPTDADLATAVGTRQPLDATLTALATIDSTAGLLEQTGADTFTKRALGVGASTSVLTRGDGDTRYAAAGSAPTAANPTAKVGTSVVNGVALTFMRSDAAPPIDLTISYTWTGQHVFNAATPMKALRSGITGGNPVNTGTSDPNEFFLAGNANVVARWGFYTSGTFWVQVSYVTDYSNNMHMVFCPNGGNFGIGNTGATPAALLHVAGTSQFDGGAKFEGQAYSPLQTLTDGATISAWDCSLGQKAKVTLGAAGRTMAAPTNMLEGATYFLWVIQDATGSRTITTWNAAFDFGAAGAPTLTTTASRADLLTFECITIASTTKLRYTGIAKGFS